jgi:hypothetical protein
MNSKLWSRKALSACLIVALYVTCSMVALATTDKVAGELIVNGKSSAQVTVNGEVAQTGRSIFSASTITTPENATATINLGKAGKLELAPKSSLTVNFDQNSISGNLTSGTVTVIGSSDTNAVINTLNGTVSNATANSSTFTVNAESAKAAAAADKDYEDCSQDTNNDGKKDCVCIDADKDGVLECDKSGAAWWIWSLVFAGAASGILYAALSDSNDATIGGGGTVVSPSR